MRTNGKPGNDDDWLRFIAQNSSEIVMVVDPDGTFRYASPTFGRIMGYDPGEAPGKNLFDLAHPDDVPRVLEETERVTSGVAPGGPAAVEYRFRHKDGSWRWAEGTFRSPFGDPEIGGLVATVRDVTRRKEAEEALRKSEEKYRTLVENVGGHAIFMLDADGYVTEWTRGAEHVKGYSAEEVVGRHLSQFSTPEEIEAGEPDRELAEAAETGRAEREAWRVIKGGERIWINEIATAVRDAKGNLVGFAKIARDLTERMRAEEALRESEERYRTLVEQIPVVAYIVRADGSDTPLYTSPQIEGLLGYTQEEGSRVRLWRERLHPEDRERVLAADERFERVDEERFGAEYRLIARDGSVVWVLEDAVLLKDAEGGPLYWQGILYDITERKEAEGQIQQLNESLERRVAERTAQLEDYTERLAASNRELQDFAHAASHDLHEPLRKISSFGQRLRTKHAGDLDEHGLDYLARMEDATGRMKGLIEDLFTLSQVTTQGRHFVPVDLGEVVRGAISDLEATLEESGARVEVGEMPTIDADRLQMRQLFHNLIGNAVKFRRPGEASMVWVRARVLPQRGDGARARGAPGGELCCITVEDNGIGFDEQYLGRIFEPFERLHGRGSYEGTGMGLAICRKVVARHGGQIIAKGSPGEGATFIVTLPVGQS